MYRMSYQPRMDKALSQLLPMHAMQLDFGRLKHFSLASIVRIQPRARASSSSSSSSL